MFDYLSSLLIYGIIVFILSIWLIIAEIYKKTPKKKFTWPLFYLLLSIIIIGFALQGIVADYNKNKPLYKVEVEAEGLEKLLNKFKDFTLSADPDKKDLDSLDYSVIRSFRDLKYYYYGMEYLTFEKLDDIIAALQEAKDELIDLSKNPGKYRERAEAIREQYPNIISYDELSGGAPEEQVAEYNKLTLSASDLDADLDNYNDMLTEVHRYRDFLQEVDGLIKSYTETE